MTAPAYFVATLVTLIVAATACHRSPTIQQTASADWWTSTNSPAISLWNSGIPMIRKPPSVVFALWTDGMVIRSVDGRLQRGQVPPQEIRKIMTEVEAAGFFSPPLAHGLVRPDGWVRRLAVMRNGELVRLDYDGYNDFRDVGPHASPSRQQMESFVQMWQRIVRAIDTVSFSAVNDNHVERELTYPDR